MVVLCSTALTRDGIIPSAFNAPGRSEPAAYGVEFREVGVVGAWPVDRHYRVSLGDGAEEETR